MNAFSSSLNPRELLIEPCDRLRFAIPFMLLTTVTLWGSFLLFSRLHLITGATLQSVIGSGGIGAILGAVEWAVLRQYIPDARWIVASAVGAMITRGGSQIIHYELLQFLQSLVMQGSSTAKTLMDAFSEPSIQASLLSSLLATPVDLGVGLLGWLILRCYVAQISWWLIFPLFVHCLSLALSTLYFFLDPTYGTAWGLNTRVLWIGIYELAFAVAFCVMIRGRGQSLRTPVSAFEAAPEVKNFQIIRTLSNHLRRQIDRFWISELSCGEPLIYLLSVNQSGAVVRVQPASVISADQISQTPIPQLMALNENITLNPEPLARFVVTFNPLGSFRLKSCRSISIVELISVLILLLLFLSFYPLWVKNLIWLRG